MVEGVQQGPVLVGTFFSAVKADPSTCTSRAWSSSSRGRAWMTRRISERKRLEIKVLEIVQRTR